MLITLIVLLISAIFFVSGKVRSDLVAICSLIILLLAQILTPAEGLAGFSNTVVIMMIGLFIVGGGIFQTGLAKMIGSRIIKLAGTSDSKLLVLVMLVTSFIGAFVSNTGTVALMLPIVVSMAVYAGTSSRRLLMPLAFASSMGGMMTLIGTPPNMIIQEVLHNYNLFLASQGKPMFQEITFFTFLPVGIIILLIGLLYLLPVTKFLLNSKEKKNQKSSDNKSLKDLVKEYGLTDNLFRVNFNGPSKALGKTIVDLDIYRKYGINVLELRRSSGSNMFVRTVNQQLASTSLVLQQGDILYLSGEFEKIQQFSRDYTCKLLDIHTDEIQGHSNTELDFYDIGIAEILIMQSSSMNNRRIAETGFRSKFNINVLGIRRGNQNLILHNIGEQKIHEGDILLIQGTWKDISRLSEESTNWVVLGRPLSEAAKVTLDFKAPIAAAIMLAMIVLMVFDSIPVAPVTAVLLAAIFMVMTGCVRSMDAAYKTINWPTIVLFASMLPMSTALEKTGVSSMVADYIVNTFGASSPYLALAAIYFATSTMTIFISNSVTALLMAPIALQCAIGVGVSPVSFLFAVTVAASMCLASPFSTPPNAMVLSAGQYTFMDYVKVGLPLQILLGIIMIFVLPLLFPF